jgi:hypothetical protein
MSFSAATSRCWSLAIRACKLYVPRAALMYERLDIQRMLLSMKNLAPRSDCSNQNMARCCSTAFIENYFKQRVLWR